MNASIDSPDWALVTGASGGIGRAFALLLAAEGRRLILVGRDAARLDTVKAELRGALASEAIALRADLSKPGAAASLHGECAARGAAVSLLVNNAGSGIFGPALENEPAALESMINLNVSALSGLCALFGRDMRARGSGAILNVGSFAGLQATPYFAAYAASKAFVLDYSLALRAELSGTGVSVSCLLPGYVRTAFDGNAGIQNPSYRAFSESNAMDADAVARFGLKLLKRRKAYGIAGARNRFASALFGLLPRALPPRVMKLALDSILRSGASQ